MFGRRTATQKQMQANRANAQHSAGPTSEAGLAASSRNAIRHGLTGRFRVMLGESQEIFDASLDRLTAEQQPVGSLELELVRLMAEHLWLRERASRCMAACFMVSQTDEQAANNEAAMTVKSDLECWMRYEAHHERAFQRAMNQLLKLRAERLKAEIGSVSRKQKEELHEHRIERQKYFVAQAQNRLEHAPSRKSEPETNAAAVQEVGETSERGAMAA